MTRLQDAIDMEVANSRVKIKSALITLETQKQNTALAKKFTTAPNLNTNKAWAVILRSTTHKQN
jgi:hypothetical protein